MKFFNVFGLSYSTAPKVSDDRRASYTAVPLDRGTSVNRRHSYGMNRRKSLDPASVLGRNLFDGRLADPRTRSNCKYIYNYNNIMILYYQNQVIRDIDKNRLSSNKISVYELMVENGLIYIYKLRDTSGYFGVFIPFPFSLPFDKQYLPKFI